MLDQKFKFTPWAGAVLAAFCSVNVAHGQAPESSPEEASSEVDQPQQAATRAAGSSAIDTMVVTADRREVNIQDAAQSITAVSADELRQANITDATDLNNYVPGLQINKSGGSERLISIRGIGSQTPQNFFNQPGVSFHMDGAYITNSIALNMGFLDVERIEVQRGPQGTVFGAASTGGTMNVVSRKPELGIFGGELSAGFGNYSYARGFGAVNVPIGDSAAVRAVIQKESRDGYAEATSIPGGYELDDANNINGRISALWQPSDEVSVQWISQRYGAKQNGPAMKSWDDPDPDPRRVTQDFPAKFEMDMDIHTGLVTWELPWATFKSTSSYQDMEVQQSFDSDRSDFANFAGYDHVVAWWTWAETYLQEFTLASRPGGIFDWVTGVFFMRSESGQYVLEYKGTDPTDPTPVLPMDLDVDDMPENVSYANVSDVTRTSWAPFAQGTLHFSDRFRGTIGIRYNDDDYKGWSASYFGPRSPRAFGSSTTTGKVALEYNLSPEHLIYTSWSRGYKPGGINPGSTDAMVVSTVTQPETVSAFEIGSKNRFLDNSLFFNAAAFYYKYKDMQYIQEDPIPYQGGIGNIPAANIWGLEMEAGWMLADNRLRLGMNATLLDGEFPDKYEALDRRLADAAGDQALEDGTAPFPWSPEWFDARGSAATEIIGNTPPNLPKLAGGVNATWFQDVGNHGVLTTRLEYLYRGKYEARIFNTPNADEVDDYGQLNMFVQYQPHGEPWRVWLTGNNLTDETAVAGRFVDPYGSGVVSDEYIPPRHFIVNFSYSF